MTTNHARAVLGATDEDTDVETAAALIIKADSEWRNNPRRLKLEADIRTYEWACRQTSRENYATRMARLGKLWSKAKAELEELT